MVGKIKLNKGLDVEKFWICVPDACRWPVPEDERVNLKTCTPAKGGSGHILRGQRALRHAFEIHERIQRQVLRLPGVSATDVGFAVKEGSRKFENVLAIRIHVTKKLSDHLLKDAGLADFTSPLYLSPDLTPQQVSAKPSLATTLYGEGRMTKEGLKFRLRENDYTRYPITGISKEDLSYYDPLCDPLSDKKPEPDHQRLSICGVPIDVIQARYFPSIQSPASEGSSGVFVGAPQTSDELNNEEQVLTGRSRVNPLVGGISIGNGAGPAGTLTTIVWDRTDGTPCVLSNWHVLAGSASATVGQPCYQPALFDGGTKADTIAHLKRWHFGELGDAAIAELSGSRHYASGEVLGLWRSLTGHQEPALGMVIRKWGRTTGFTEGFIDGIQLATNIDFGNGVVRFFKNQFHIAPLFSGEDVSQGGDSGSLVVSSYKPEELVEDLLDCLYVLKECGTNLKRRDDVCNAYEKYLNKIGDTEPDIQDFIEELKSLCILIAPDRAGRKTIRNVVATLSTLHSQLPETLSELGIDIEAKIAAQEDKCNRKKLRAYFAVGMIFAGDTPGSPFGEFALASPFGALAKELQFSLRPVFEPRSSFRRMRAVAETGNVNSGARSQRSLVPGTQRADPRGQGPQPDPEESQSGG